jgi:hypothetical protein
MRQARADAVQQPGAQLTTVSPHTLTDNPHAIDAQSGSVHATHAFPVHVSPVWHVPHDSVPPHPLLAVPHVFPAHGSAVGAQHVFALQTSPTAHVLPHVTVPPHPSGTVPHGMPAHACACVFGVQHAFV